MTGVEIWEKSRRGLRWAFVQVPSGLIVPIIVFWGADFTIRHHLNWGVLGWLLVLGGVWAYVLLPIVIPALLLAGVAANLRRSSRSWRAVAYAVTLAIVGAIIGANTDAISSIAAALCGFAAGFAIAHIEWKWANAS